MANVGEDCTGDTCNYFHRRYGTRKYKGADVPDFDIVNEYCSHPMVYMPAKNAFRLGEVGTLLQSFKSCPKKRHDGSKKV